MTPGLASPKPRPFTLEPLWEAVPKRPVEQLIEMAFREDGVVDDITTASTVDFDIVADGRLIANGPGIVAGLPVAEMVFTRMDREITFISVASDGGEVKPGQELARVTGTAANILSSERSALNFLQRMSGIATDTGRFVAAVRHTKAQILDTRKTLPGFRGLDKYAVACGGGSNHRSSLDAGILIKDNHIVAACGITPALQRVKQKGLHAKDIEIEVDRIDQIEEALAGGANGILLDNMSVEELGAAVRLIGNRAFTEASGGVTLDSVSAIAESGVDYISIGSLTHSVRALDIRLDLEISR